MLHQTYAPYYYCLHDGSHFGTKEVLSVDYRWYAELHMTIHVELTKTIGVEHTTLCLYSIIYFTSLSFIRAHEHSVYRDRK